jgi:hypothetical protein
MIHRRFISERGLGDCRWCKHSRIVGCYELMTAMLPLLFIMGQILKYKHDRLVQYDGKSRA